jgi:hypothetical protein
MFEVLIIASPILCLIFYTIYVYNYSLELNQKVLEHKNNLQAYEQRAQKIFGGIIEQLNISGAYEENLLLNITNRREGTEFSIDDAKSTVTKALARLEAYPNINTISMRKEFQNQIAEIEDKLQRLIVAYNNSAKDYNSFVLSFPASIFCKMVGIVSAEYLSSIA